MEENLKVEGADSSPPPLHGLDRVKVVDSCWISSTEWSDTFRNSFVYGKKQESRKEIYHNRAKQFHLPEEV